MKTNKKGFTLIELMVVIVIIGILAAIAIPKLFGMTAKAKASEVGPAAGTWSKLEQAYFMEASSVGSFAQIAYTPPGGVASGPSYPGATNFSYAGSADNIEPATWSATAKGAWLPTDCPTSGGTWSASHDGNSPSVTANGCPALTPKFTDLQ